MFPPRAEDDPDYHPIEALTFTEHTRMWEGVNQFQCLTNTVVEDKLLSDIDPYGEKCPDTDHFMQRLAFQRAYLSFLP